jgi:hydrogenase expression/formation protein HypE
VTASGAQPGNALVLTKAAGLEGSHILANDFASRLTGLSAEVLEEARGYAAELSVLPEARLALELGVTAMHDPTEAGIVGALWEMAEASDCGFRVDVARIPIRPATRAVCAALGVDPLRLIASGALLIACTDGAAMVQGLQQSRIQATQIGAMTERSDGRQLVHEDRRVEEIERLERDELYRLLSS